MINVTKPFLPPYEEYIKYIQGIWQRGWLTNNGPLVNELELKLKEYLDIKHLLFLTNGTVALQIAIKALELKGEIITTPFSYVATTSSIVWEGCEPVFVDIDKQSLNIDPSLIESAITERTSAILATHVFGNPCDVEKIEQIAKKHQLKVIYDGAHAFGVKYKKKSIFDYGDISTSSFHATKLYHTVEGGCVTTPHTAILKKMVMLRNFGHTDAEVFDGVGINGKNSEFHAAMGLCNLKFIDTIMLNRKQQWLNYKKHLQELNVGILTILKETEYNYSYFPIIFNSEEKLLESVKVLNQNHIFPRRYFYPSLNQINYVKNIPCPVSEMVSKTILCLPLFDDLKEEEQNMICRLLLRVQNN